MSPQKRIRTRLLACCALDRERTIASIQLLRLLTLTLVYPAVAAEVLEGRVAGVHDGDTITVLDSNRQQHRIRLAGIDALEKAQPDGQRSKQHLAELAFGKDAKADCYKVDRYDRDVCTVFVNGQDVGPAQLDAGLAWWYRNYGHEQLPKDRVDYEAAESSGSG